MTTQKSNRREFQWLDAIKGIAMIWIFLNHVVERMFGILQGTGFHERLAELGFSGAYGTLDIPLSLLRDVGWYGDYAVDIFILASGFGLAWGLLSKQGLTPIQLGNFYWRRVQRIYPLWWGAHIFFITLSFMLPVGLDREGKQTILSLLGFRFTNDTFYYLSPAWWYVGLLLLLYLIFPILWRILRSIGPWKLLFASIMVSIGTSVLGQVRLDNIALWHRGTIFLERLPVFVFGIALAYWYHNAPDTAEERLRSRRTQILAVTGLVVGIIAGIWGSSIAVDHFLISVGGFLVLYNLLSRAGVGLVRNPIRHSAEWIGRHSYSIYLVHHPILLILPKLFPTSIKSYILVGCAVVLTGIIALFLEREVKAATTGVVRLRKRFGVIGAGAVLVILITGSVGVVLGGEIVMRNVAPGDVCGWGERTSLASHPEYGWYMIPSKTTHLRWESYDYTTVSNELGFPGPSYEFSKEPDTFRILVTGDAFTSAEGVNTEDAWPRLLESKLAEQEPDRNIEVINFAITGYGPNQYVSVLEDYIPLYQPDLVIIGFFVNDFQDALMSPEDYSIGFDEPSPTGFYCTLKMDNIRQYLKIWVYEPFIELIGGGPRPKGVFYGHFGYLRPDNQELWNEGKAIVSQRLEQIKEIAQEANADVMMVMIPAPVQVCGPDDLEYYPRGINIADTDTYDLDLPQNVAKDIADILNIRFYDLRDVFEQYPDQCFYQPRNLHWVEEGHHVVADYIADVIIADGLVDNEN